MSKLVNRNKGNLFKKRHYIAIIKNMTSYLTPFFGYKRKPFLFESKNEDGVIMKICGGYKKEHYAVFYDYMQWKRCFGHLDYEAQAASVMYVIAHEMRHYYQLRQLESEHPREDARRLAAWRQNRVNPQYVGENCTPYEFFMQPMELDASLFAYVFVADETDLLMGYENLEGNYLAELERYYIELFGRTDEELFPYDLLEG